MLLLTASGRLVAANPAARRKLQLDEVDGLDLESLLANDPDALRGYLRRVAGSGDWLPGRLNIRCGGRDSISCRVEGTAVAPAARSDDALVILRCHVGPSAGAEFRLLNEKITELARAVNLHRQARRDLERLVAILNATPDLVCTIDPDGALTYLNHGGREMLGIPQDADLSDVSLERIFVDWAYRAVTDLGLPVAAEGGMWTGETALCAADGREVPASQVILGHHDRRGTLLYYSTIARDLTEQMEAAAALRDMDGQLRQAQKMEAVGKLAGGIAHDFNNLLTAILGAAELLEMDLGDADLARGHVEHITTAGRRAAELTSHLLAFARRRVVTPRVIDANDVVGRAAKLARRLLSETITLRTETVPLPSTRIDPGSLEQVLVNLMINARDAMEDGGMLSVTTGYESPAGGIGPGEIIIAVTDTGCGMSEEVLQRAFEPFFTTKDVGKGTGLGLAMSYGIITQAGGRIAAESTPGRGSTFRIYLPATMEPAATLTTAGFPMPHPGNGNGNDNGSSNGKHTATILLVEDEPKVRELAAYSLRRHGYTVLEAGHGEAAVAECKAHRGRIDLLLTDVVLPDIRGPQVAERITELVPEIRVLYMSGYADHDLFTDDHGERPANLLSKPFAPSELAARVSEALTQ